MGRILGQTERRNNDLGEPVTAAITAAVTLASIASKQGWFGGGSKCSESDNQKKQQLAQLIDKLLTSSDKTRLVQMANANIAPTGTAMAEFFVGGHDCLHKNVHPDDERFLSELPIVLKQREQEQQAQKQTNMPANMSTSELSFNLNPDEKYFLIGSGLIGAGTIGYLAIRN
jgi:hypothetical protein